MVKHVPLLHLSSPLKAMPPRRPGWNEDHRMTFTRWLDALILKNHLLTYFVSRNDRTKRPKSGSSGCIFWSSNPLPGGKYKGLITRTKTDVSTSHPNSCASTDCCFLLRRFWRLKLMPGYEAHFPGKSLVTFLGWLSYPFKGLRDLQLGDKQVTLNHLVGGFWWHNSGCQMQLFGIFSCPGQEAPRGHD